MRLLTAIILTLFTSMLVGTAGAGAGVRAQSPAQEQPAGGQDFEALNRRARELYGAKKYDEAAKLAQAAFEAAERQFGPDSAEAGSALLNLGNIQAARRDTAKARKVMTRLVELRERRPGAPLESEREALEFFTCLDASDLRAKPDLDLNKRIHHILVEDSVLEQGHKLAPGGAELKVGEQSSKPAPKYPEQALSTRASGAAALRITIDEAGRVVEVTPLACSSRLFVESAEEAARRATFSPTLVGGKPVSVRSVIIYRYIHM